MAPSSFEYWVANAYVESFVDMVAATNKIRIIISLSARESFSRQSRVDSKGHSEKKLASFHWVRREARKAVQHNASDILLAKRIFIIRRGVQSFGRGGRGKISAETSR